MRTIDDIDSVVDEWDSAGFRPNRLLATPTVWARICDECPERIVGMKLDEMDVLITIGPPDGWEVVTCTPWDTL